MIFKIAVLFVGVSIADAKAQQAINQTDLEAVEEKLQQYDAGPVDGIWDEKSAAALRSYQRDRGLPETDELTPELSERVLRRHPVTRAQWQTVENMDCEAWNHGP